MNDELFLRFTKGVIRRPYEGHRMTFSHRRDLHLDSTNYKYPEVKDDLNLLIKEGLVERTQDGWVTGGSRDIFEFTDEGMRMYHRLRIGV